MGSHFHATRLRECQFRPNFAGLIGPSSSCGGLSGPRAVARGHVYRVLDIAHFLASAPAGADGGLRETSMKMILFAIGVVGSLAAATTFSLGGDLVQVTGAIVAGPPAPEPPAYPIEPRPGYIAYGDYDIAVPGPGCYWTRMPIYDPDRNVVGWRGRPMAVCR